MKNQITKLKGGVRKMEKSEVKGDKPDFTGKLDVAAWYNTDTNGKTYLSVVLGNRVNLFSNEQKPEGKEIEDIFE